MNDFYSEISAFEYQELVFGNKLFSISTKDHQTLVNELNIDLRLYGSGRYGIRVDRSGGQSRKENRNGDNLDFIISKVPDEWFAVHTEQYYPPYFEKFYKCDQFEGLLKLLTDEVGIVYESHIKLFENFNKSYEEISESDFRIIRGLSNGDVTDYRSKNWEDFTPKEISIITDMMKRIEMEKCQWHSGNVFIKYWLNALKYGIIIKLKDEWFYLLVNDRVSYRYYKCDQFDGLLNLLKTL